MNSPCQLYPRKQTSHFHATEQQSSPKRSALRFQKTKRRLNVNRAYIGDNVHALHNHGDFMRSSDRCRSNE